MRKEPPLPPIVESHLISFVVDGPAYKALQAVAESRSQKINVLVAELVRDLLRKREARNFVQQGLASRP